MPLNCRLTRRALSPKARRSNLRLESHPFPFSVFYFFRSLSVKYRARALRCRRRSPFPLPPYFSLFFWRLKKMLILPLLNVLLSLSPARFRFFSSSFYGTSFRRFLFFLPVEDPPDFLPGSRVSDLPPPSGTPRFVILFVPPFCRDSYTGRSLI